MSSLSTEFRENRPSSFSVILLTNKETNKQRENITSSVEETTEWLRERIEYLDIFLFSAHHSMVFYFQWFVYWWKGASDFSFFFKYY